MKKARVAVHTNETRNGIYTRVTQSLHSTKTGNERDGTKGRALHGDIRVLQITYDKESTTRLACERGVVLVPAFSPVQPARAT